MMYNPSKKHSRLVAVDETVVKLMVIGAISGRLLKLILGWASIV